MPDRLKDRPGNDVTVIDRPTITPVKTPADANKTTPEEPKMYAVVLLNDDYTPAPLVSDILASVFGLHDEIAWQKMLEAHRAGRANVGTFSKDTAETKIANALAQARAEGDFPLAFDLQEA